MTCERVCLHIGDSQMLLHSDPPPKCWAKGLPSDSGKWSGGKEKGSLLLSLQEDPLLMDISINKSNLWSTWVAQLNGDLVSGQVTILGS